MWHKLIATALFLCVGMSQAFGAEALKKVRIASKGSGNLSAVAPGVGEALIATAAALAVAIPATFGYNIFASRLNRYDARLENFSTAVIALLVREGRI